MNKANSDSKVKKTFVRNCEQRVKSSGRSNVVREVESSAFGLESRSSLKASSLNEPTICSSAALANYLSEVKNSGPPPVTIDDLNVDKGELCAKMTKKLNFHVTDRIYKNLIELNSTIEEEFKAKKDKRRPRSVGPTRKDLEPDIEDFCEDEVEPDSPPKIPVVKPKLRPIKVIETGDLHKLVASFEVL
ncbi:hypothetical protein NE865_10681 [Phthorimaea operculella]|nr:hypothetical protein NE865_10681 [Phthorimaea operculella]